MKKLVIVAVLFLLVGCSQKSENAAKTGLHSESTAVLIEQQEASHEGVVTSVQLTDDRQSAEDYALQAVQDKPIDYSNYNNGKRYSYLEQLALDKQEAVNAFMTSNELHYLSDFTPEEMVIVYLYFTSIGDPYLIYAITYNGGVLPDKETFVDEYRDYLSHSESEMALHYRYFDSIKISETFDESNVHVTIAVGAGIHTHSIILGLQYENEIWKLDMYHWILDKKENKSD